jgi:hypothetical protein
MVCIDTQEAGQVSLIPGILLGCRGIQAAVTNTEYGCKVPLKSGLSFS